MRRIFQHGLLVAMVRLMADKDIVDGPHDMIPVGWPGGSKAADQPIHALFMSPCTGRGQTLHEGTVRHSNDAGIHSMVTMVITVFESIFSQDVIQSQVMTNLGRYTARDDPNASGAYQFQILLGNAGHVAGVIQRTSNEVLLFTQPLFIAVWREALGLSLQMTGKSVNAQQNVIVLPSFSLEVLSRFIRSPVRLDAVDLRDCNCLVVHAVIQGPGERQDVLDLNLVRQQHAGADLLTAIGTAPVGCIRTQLLP